MKPSFPLPHPPAHPALVLREQHWCHGCAGLSPCARQHPHRPAVGAPWKGSCASLTFAHGGKFHCKTTPRGRICPLETGIMPQRVCCGATAGVCCDVPVEEAETGSKAECPASEPLRQGWGPEEPPAAAAELSPGLGSPWPGAATCGLSGQPENPSAGKT